MIIELKWDKDADTAIRQIKEKRYAGNLKGYGKEVLLVGVNYDKRTKKHECVIETVKNGMPIFDLKEIKPEVVRYSPLSS